ncbi:MAG: PKD domain-containing protein, partial [Candidatus Promineifilaceae bacterium]
SPQDPTPGQPFVYNLQWCNNRGAAAGPAWLTDTLPVEAVYNGWQEEQSWQHFWTEVSFDGSELVLYAPSLPGDQCEILSLYMYLPIETGIGTTLTNTVVIYTEDDVEPGNDWMVHEVDVGEPRIDLEIYKEFHNGVLAPEGWINYFISYWNNGNVSAPVFITETIPSGLTFNGAWWGGNQPDEGQPLPPPIYNDGDIVVWQLDELAPGDSRWFHVDMTIDAGPGEFGNCVEISGVGDDADPSNNVSCTTVSTYPPGPNIRVHKNSDWAAEGSQIQYNLTFQNLGSEPLFNVPFTDTFPVGTYSVDEPQIDSSYPVYLDDMTGSNMWGFLVEEFYPGDQVNIQFTVELADPSPGLFYTNTLEAQVIPGEVDESDNTFETLDYTGADLYVDKELAAGDMMPGELVTFTLAFGNDRFGHLGWWGLQNNAVMTDTLPDGLEFVSSAMHYCWPDVMCEFLPVQDGNELIWDLWPLGAGEENEIVLTVRITDTAEGGDILTNTVEIQSSTPEIDVEPYYDNNFDSVDFVVAAPRFEVSKVYDSSEVAGMTIAYTLTVENTGSEPGTDVVLRDALPEGLTYGGGDGWFDGADVYWTFPEILPGESAMGTFTATLPCSGTITNDDYLVESSNEFVVTGPGPAVSFDVVTPTIDLSFDYSPMSIIAGDSVYFTATGTTDGTPLTLTWSFGDGTNAEGQFVTNTYEVDDVYDVVLMGTDTCGYQEVATDTLLVDAPTIAASFDQSDSSVPVNSTIYFTDTSTTDGQPIVEWMWDFGDGSAPSYEQDPSHLYSIHDSFDVTLTVTDSLGYSDSVTVLDAATTLAPVFEISKDYESSEIAGTLITYTLTFTNIGDLADTGIVVTDELPSNVTWLSGGDYDDVSGIITWDGLVLGPGASDEVQFVGKLGCSGQVVNDSYQVADSDLGVSSSMGDPVSFTIQSPTIVAGFILSSDNVVTGETVTFTSTSTTDGGPFVSWTWDFGDGITDTGEVVSHIYTEAGEYDVTLTVMDACGNTESITVLNAIIVEEAEVKTFIPLLMHG